MTLELDDEAIELIKEFKHYQEDKSYANHLAYKVLELYEVQSELDNLIIESELK